MDKALRILVVEDSEDDTYLIVRKLKSNGYDPQFKRVENYSEMASALQENQWDLIVSDHNLPEFNSFEALKLLREVALDIPFIVVSGSIGEEIAVETMKAGAHDYIMKGNLSRLIPAIKRELREAEERRARKRAEKQLTYHASYDSLTGFFNRRTFEAMLETFLNSSDRKEPTHVLAYIDLDRFKVVNDTCGHHAGDELLRQVTRLLKDGFRSSDKIGRLGGDEFAVLMECCPLERASAVTRKLCQSVSQYRFTWETHSFVIGISIGLVEVKYNDQDVSGVLRAADSACFVAKRAGGNRTHIYRPDDEDVSRRRYDITWVENIQKALDEKRFRLFFQSIVPTNELNELAMVEILLRMTTEQGDIVTPKAFLPAAERYSLASKLDKWVIDTLLDWIIDHPLQNEPTNGFSINLSGISLNDDEFLSFLLSRINQSSVSPEKLCFEITETVAIRNLTKSRSFMEKLVQAGCKLALDDFGTGFSSFGYLRSLPVHYIKIDGSFVHKIVDDEIAFTMVKSINEIGQVMGKKTIAEFAENQEIIDKLTEIGVDFVQGYHFNRPQSVDYLVSN